MRLSLRRLARPVLLALLAASAASAQTVTALEYFVDTDPGVGAAIPIPVSPSGTVTASIPVATAGLSVGLHTLHVRARRSDGRWGFVRTRPFVISALPAAPPSNLVVAAEYFVDVDPGIGLATPVSVSPSGTVSATVQVPTAGLAEGLHTFHARVRRSDGRWGSVRSRPFAISVPAPYEASPVVAVEWFVDVDPGVGAATPFAITAGQTVTLSTTVGLGPIAEGGHVFGVRARDATGRWGAPVWRPFVYGQMPAVVLAAPADNATGTPTNPTLEWAEAGGAVAYHLRLATDPAFTDPLVDDSTLAAVGLTVGPLAPLTAHFWQVRARAASGWGAWSPARRFTTGTDVADEDAPDGLPTAFALHAPFPNPLRSTATVPVDVPAAAHVRVSVYDVQGRRVAVIVDEEMPAGAHHRAWSPAGLAAGVYVVRMEAAGSGGAFVAARRVVVMR